MGWVCSAWTADGYGNTPRAWKFQGGDGCFDFTKRMEWPEPFTRWVEETIVPGTPVEEWVLEACTVEASAEEYPEDDDATPEGLSKADVNHGAHTLEQALKGRLGDFAQCDPWQYGFVRWSLCKAQDDLQGRLHLNPTLEDFQDNGEGAPEQWLGHMVDAVMVAAAIQCTWLHPIAHVPPLVVLGEPRDSRQLTSRKKEEARKKVEDWAERHGLRFHLARTTGKGSALATPLAKTAEVWCDAHKPHSMSLVDTGHRLMARLDSTVALAFLLKFSQLEETQESLFDLLDPDMLEHILTADEHTSYPAWGQAVRRTISKECEIMDRGEYPEDGETRPFDERAARAGDSVIVQACHKEFLALSIRGGDLFSPFALMRWVVPRGLLNLEEVRRLYAVTPSTEEPAGYYNPAVHDSTSFSFASSTEEGAPLLPVHQLVPFLRGFLDTLEAAEAVPDACRTQTRIAEAWLYWHAYVRSRRGQDGFNTANLIENMQSVVDALQDPQAAEYVRRDLLVEGYEATPAALGQRLEEYKQFVDDFASEYAEKRAQEFEGEKEGRAEEKALKAKWAKYITTGLCFGVQAPPKKRRGEKLPVHIPKGRLPMYPDADALEDIVRLIRGVFALGPKTKKTPGLGHTTGDILAEPRFQAAEKGTHQHHAGYKAVVELVDWLAKELSVPDAETVQVHALTGIRNPVRHASVAEPSNVHVVINLTALEADRPPCAWTSGGQDDAWKADAPPALKLTTKSSDTPADMKGRPLAFPAHFAFSTGEQAECGLKLLVSFGPRAVSEAFERDGGTILTFRGIRRELLLLKDWAARAAKGHEGAGAYSALAADAPWREVVPWSKKVWNRKPTGALRQRNKRPRGGDGGKTPAEGAGAGEEPEDEDATESEEDTLTASGTPKDTRTAREQRSQRRNKEPAECSSKRRRKEPETPVATSPPVLTQSSVMDGHFTSSAGSSSSSGT